MSKENKLIGKVRLVDIVDKKIKNYKLFTKKPIILNADISLLETIKTLSNFVGESIPIIDKKNKKILGIISENDVLAAYLKISNEINHIEKD